MKICIRSLYLDGIWRRSPLSWVQLLLKILWNLRIPSTSVCSTARALSDSFFERLIINLGYKMMISVASLTAPNGIVRIMRTYLESPRHSRTLNKRASSIWPGNRKLKTFSFFQMVICVETIYMNWILQCFYFKLKFLDPAYGIKTSDSTLVHRSIQLSDKTFSC
jgi:hypothetical protein